MKKLLTILALSIPALLTAQELTADTVASAPSLLDEILKALLVAFVSLLGYIGSTVIPLINAYLKGVMHFRGASVVADAVTQAFGELLANVQHVAADGVITADEMNQVRKRAADIALGKLRNLSGFYKKDLIGWLDEVLEVELGKLLSRALGYSGFDSKTR